MIKRRCTVISAGGDSNMCDVDDENHNEMASQNLNNAAVQHTTLIVGLLQDFTFEFYTSIVFISDFIVCRFVGGLMSYFNTLFVFVCI